MGRDTAASTGSLRDVELRKSKGRDYHLAAHRIKRTWKIPMERLYSKILTKAESIDGRRKPRQYWSAFVTPSTDSSLTNEPGFDLLSQIDDAIVWTFERLNFEPESRFAERARWAQTQPLPPSTMSSFQLNHTLQEENVVCLTRYYHEDHERLALIQTKHCWTDTCRLGLDSILSRKLPFLK